MRFEVAVKIGYSNGQTDDINGSDPSASGSGLPQVTHGDYRGAAQLGSTIHFSH